MHKAQLWDCSRKQTRPCGFCLLRNCKNWIYKQCQYDILSQKCFECLQIKMFYNFLITFSNAMSQISPSRQNIFYEFFQ